MKCLFPGSFDPFTLGHKSIVDRTLQFAEEVVIAIGVNAGKKSMFSLEERMAQSWTSRDFVRVIAFSSNYVLLNFNRGETYADYIDYQKPYADRYFGDLNEYFTMDAPTAGVKWSDSPVAGSFEAGGCSE